LHGLWQEQVLFERKGYIMKWTVFCGK